ncbi:conserved hypothetical protein, partial [Ricinus communis]
VRVLLDQPVRAVVAAVLLVGDERQHEIPPRRQPGRDGGQHHRAEILHVDRAPAPQEPVAHLAGKRRYRPIGGARGHHVQMPLHEQRGQRRIGARDPRDHVRPLRLGLQNPRRNPVPVKEFRDVLGGEPFARRLPAAVVGGVEPDQVRAQRNHVDLSHKCPAPPLPRWP